MLDNYLDDPRMVGQGQTAQAAVHIHGIIGIPTRADAERIRAATGPNGVYTPPPPPPELVAAIEAQKRQGGR